VTEPPDLVAGPETPQNLPPLFPDGSAPELSEPANLHRWRLSVFPPGRPTSDPCAPQLLGPCEGHRAWLPGQDRPHPEVRN
jgi:hypothetical protein